MKGVPTDAGADAEFKEAISPYKADVWKRLSPRERLRRSWALRSRLPDPRAVHGHYKLTPALNLENLARGHGFHFILPGNSDEAFLDVMGHPPRATSFAQSRLSLLPNRPALL